MLSHTKRPCRSVGPKKALTFMGFFSITAAMVISVHEYPTFAVAGMQIPFFLLLVGFLWFLPVALCSAEMATIKNWEEGGIFSWVGGMLGERFGFVALFFQWIQITVCFIAIIYFMLSALAYLFDFPALDDNPVIKLVGVLVIFWAISLSQLKGIKRTVRFAKFGFILGVILPTAILFVLGLMYMISGQPLQLEASASSLDQFVDCRPFACVKLSSRKGAIAPLFKEDEQEWHPCSNHYRAGHRRDYLGCCVHSGRRGK